MTPTSITDHNNNRCLQYHHIPIKQQPAPGGKHRWFRIRFTGGMGGDAVNDMDKGHVSTVIPAWAILAAVYNEYDYELASINVGETDSTIACNAEMIICIKSGEPAEFVKSQQESMNEWLQEEYGQENPKIKCSIEKCEKQETIIDNASFEALMTCLEQIPQGILKTSDGQPKSALETNNVGIIKTTSDEIFVSTLSWCADEQELQNLSKEIAQTFISFGATSEVVK